MEEVQNQAETGKNRRGWRPLHWLLLVLGVLVVVIAAVMVWVYLSFRPVAGDNDVQVTVAQGETISQLSQDLQQKHLIHSSFMFKLYARLTHTGVLIRAGQYKLHQGSTIPALMTQLQTGKVMGKSVKVTIPEGFDVVQIADRLQQDGICSKTAFLNQVQRGTYAEPFLKQLPNHTDVRYRLEGYLFPDTYDFVKGESPHRVVDEMLQDFQTHITPDLAVMKQENLTLWKVITKASLVEREAKVEKERPLIASVIHNRLHHKPPMKLQIDATIEYIIGHTNLVTDNDLKVKSPYNTYLNYGLPPGPIASPGMQSINAILHPAKTQYLYYVVKNNKTGEHYFAKTYAQQLRNEAKSQANLKKYS